MATFDSPNGRVVVVCDGMGGQNAGDVASQLAVTVIQDILTDNKFNTPEEAITKSIIAANQAILMRSAQDVSLSGMGSTCVMLIIADDKVYYGSVGDSRIYYLSGGMIRQITKDQSYVQTLVDAGELTQEAAEHHKDKNQITNALGIEGMTPPVVCQMPISPDPGSVFLLCSDGLSGMVNNSVINHIISNSSMTLEDKAKQLIKMANEAGGIDNITVQLVEFPRVAATPGLAPSKANGNSAVRKSSKNRAVLYWAVSIVCLILAIGGITYWMITKDDTKSKQNTSIKTEVKEKTPRKSVPTNNAKQETPTPPKVEEQPQVKIIEKTKVEKPKKETPKKKTEKQIEKALENLDKPDNLDDNQTIMKTVNNLGNEKGGEE